MDLGSDNYKKQQTCSYRGYRELVLYGIILILGGIATYYFKTEIDGLKGKVEEHGREIERLEGVTHILPKITREQSRMIEETNRLMSELNELRIRLGRSESVLDSMIERADGDLRRTEGLLEKLEANRNSHP